MAKFSETSNAKKGGLFVGDSHAEGGIPAIVTDTGQPIEVEGGEAIINKKATALHWEELSKINQSAGGGVPIPAPDDADKVLEKYSQGGKITNKEKKVVFDKWKKLVNMTFTELSRYYHSKEGKESGLSEAEAKEQGISSGRESAEWILKMKKTNWKKWTDDMWKWANKQISFISRMSGLQGDLTDEKGKKTRKYKALMIWGNNPKKKNSVSFKTGGTTDSNSAIKGLKALLSFATEDERTEILEQINSLENPTDSKNNEYIDYLVKVGILDAVELYNLKNYLKSKGLSSLGLLPDEIKTDPEYRQIKQEFEIASKKAKQVPIFKYPKNRDRVQAQKDRQIAKQIIDNFIQSSPNKKVFKTGNLISSSRWKPEHIKQLKPINLDTNDVHYKNGGDIPKRSNTYAFVTSTSTTGKRLFKVFDHIPTNKEVYDYYQQVNKKIGTPIEIVDSSISIEVLHGFDRENFLKLLNEVALIQFSSKIKDIKNLMFSFDYKTFNVYEFEAELNYGRIVKVKMVDGVIFLEDKYEKGGELLKRKDGSYSERGLWDNVRANIGSGKEPTPEMLKQEELIKQKYYLGGGLDESFSTKADKIIELIKQELTNRNLDNRFLNRISKSQTDYGQSWYVRLLSPEEDFPFEIRISDHSVQSINRLMDKKYVAFINVYQNFDKQDAIILIDNYIDYFNSTKLNLDKRYAAFKKMNAIGDYVKEKSKPFIDKLKADGKAIYYTNQRNFRDIWQQKFPNAESLIAIKDNPYEDYRFAYIDKNNGYGNLYTTRAYFNELVDLGNIVAEKVPLTNTIEQLSNIDLNLYMKSQKDNVETNFETGGAVQKSSPDTYENKLLQIRVIGGENSYYKRINQEWKFLSSKELELLKEGTKHELEHIETIEAFKRKDVPSNIVASFIAFDHINETPDYYKKLEQAIPEKMEQGKKIETNPVVYKETIDFKNNSFDLKIQSVKFEDGKTAYAGDVSWKEILIAGFPAIPERTLEDLKDKMHKIVRETEITANSYSKNIVFINRKSYRVSDDTYYSALQKTPKATLSKDSLRYFLENHQSAGMLASGTDLSNYDDLAILRSIMLKILREEEGIKNEYTVPYNFDELNSLKEQALIEFNIEHKKTEKKEETYKPKEEPIKEIPMEKEPENPTGLVTNNWNEVPVRWKNVKAVRPVTFSINPYDKGLQSIVKVFTDDDQLRPIMSAIHFEEKGLVCTDAHKLLHIAYNHSDFIGNYQSLDSKKAYRSYSEEEIQAQLKEKKFPNWEAVIPKDSEYVYEIDTLKLYQYCKVAVNYANKTTNQVAFKYDNKSIGFNVKFLIDSLEAMMKIQKAPKLYIHLTEPSRAAILSFDKSFSVISSTYTLLMPVMLWRGASPKYDAISQIYGASDIDLNKSIGCYFDFTDNNIHNANGTIADYKESYGDSGGLPLDIITMMDRFIKIGKTKIPILENVLVDGNGIRVDSLDSRIEIANDWDIPQGIYSISNNALVKSGMNANIEDFPRITKRVPTSNETFSINADIFKFYIEKAANHISNDDLRPVMNGICFESVNSQLSIVSTDSHTLFHADLSKYATNYSHNFSYIIPDIKQVLNFCKNIESEEVKFYVDNLNPVNFRIGAGRIHFEGRLEDGKYPNWRAIVPQTFSNQLIFDLKDMYNCLNNEMAKSFSKEVDNNAKNLTIFNQSNKIFISETQDKNKPDNAKTKEICEIKITKKELSEPSEFNIGSNFVLLMPVMNTNGTYFNFNVGKFNNVISTIGKEKVIIDYNTLSSVYIFTSDNLDYKTSDAYKPTKVDKPKIDKPIKNIISKEPKTYPAAIKTMDKPIAKFTPEAVTLIPKHQLKVVKNVGNKEFEQTIIDINNIVARIPKLYGQDGIKDKMVYLHYFYGDQDWFVTELDKSTGECFGYADLGYGAELGYMSIPEFVSNGKVELDFYFEPKKWSAIAKPDDSAFEKQNKAVKPLAEKPKSIPAKADNAELKDAVRGLEAFMKTTSDATEKSQLKQAINGLKALLK